MALSKKRKICVVTGSRAEYGLLQGLMTEIRSDRRLRLQTVVTGTHLSTEFGSTWKELVGDGFRIDAKIPIAPLGGDAYATTMSLSKSVAGFARAFRALKPDLLVLHGDRYEILGAAEAALLARIPIAHISGGELTEGAVDDSIRHCLTKLSHLHFVSAEPYRRRVLQLGEEPSRVFQFGDPGVENVQKLPLLSRRELEASMGFALGERNFLVTYHPTTLGGLSPAEGVRRLLRALDRFPEARIIFTKSNADAGGRAVNAAIEAYARRHADRMAVFSSLGRLRFLSALKHVDVLIGNSSSGIVEAPALRTPTVNIGTRQDGRLKAASILDCPETTSAVVSAISRSLSPAFRRTLSTRGIPYRGGPVSRKTKDVLRTFPLENLTVKIFHDLPERRARK